MLIFDIGANRGDFTLSALQRGYFVVALEPAPKVFQELVIRFLYNMNVVPLKFAVSDKDFERVSFYEAEEDGLSTLNKDWLTSDEMRYAGKPFREIEATTCTIDWLVEKYGVPELIKIDVEGGEWAVFRGMTKKYGYITFEWVIETLDQHIEQLKYLETLGYTEWGIQGGDWHFVEPEKWLPLSEVSSLETIPTEPLDWGMIWVR